MYGISRSETDSSGNDKKEKEVVNVLEPVASTRVARIYEDPNALAQPEDTHVGEFGTKRDLVRQPFFAFILQLRVSHIFAPLKRPSDLSSRKPAMSL